MQQHPEKLFAGRSARHGAIRLVEDSTSSRWEPMKFRIHLIAKRQALQTMPQSLATSEIDVETVDQAREAAYSLADRLLPQTHTIEIENAKGKTVERLERDGAAWRKVNA
ncbi:MAG: hypothetical protein WB697_13860 [Stellaceae bacterium]